LYISKKIIKSSVRHPPFSRKGKPSGIKMAYRQPYFIQNTMYSSDNVGKSKKHKIRLQAVSKSQPLKK
jgi:hypothetical protein